MNGDSTGDLLRQLQDLNLLDFGQGYSDLSGISGTDIATRLGQAFGIGEGILKPGMFPGISADLVKKIMPSTYSPFMEASTQPILGSLVQSFTGKPAKTAAGGLAGSGGWEQYKKTATDVYGRDVGTAIGQAKAQESSAFDKIQEIVNQWKKTAQSI
jgi:hypothetical protein